ncbi:TRAP transporter substrate-binding protein [Bacillus sp. B15-48]|uniref:TRAP transporter substrate-binding protein n=1 Tax=Bacillus sp. B15-48 TaxID=1548601 RepID=UPI00193F3BA3|nr:TRAP transporter substrate-binding protein [Bacillus sp. B15-48]MBM4764890.1 DctP family TRAP transporter solute-binding subunit [Bacillus sp. B15-48]
MKKLSLVFLAFLTALTLNGCQILTGEPGVTELKLAHNQTLDHPVHLSLAEFGRIVEERSNNDIKVTIYPNAQLGSEREVLELTQSGAVDVAKVSASALEGFEPDYSIFSLPYVFEDYQEFENAMNNKNITNQLYFQTEPIGFIGLTYYNAGERHLYTKNRIINTVEDMRGLKTRVQPSQTSVNMIEALGGLPTPMSYGEVYTALQSGVIDAAENNETALVGNNHGEVAKYYMYTGHQIVPDMLIMNAKRYNQLSDEHKQIIHDAAEESTVYHEDVWSKTIAEMTETAKNKMGVNFIEVDKTSFIDAVMPLHEEYANNERTRDIYQLIKGNVTHE